MQNNSCKCFLYLWGMLNHSFFVYFFLISQLLSSQVPYPRDYFAPPLNIPITLAGNFGEIRPQHLHAGFDIRTNNKEGLPVYAVADGYVSRIRISPVGYGKALYITHPNGYVSVYGHLKGFNTGIQAKAYELQQLLQSFELDTLINRELLPVKKGELIGFSGNTGSSQAPHLHFEIRDEITEKPINPYFFGYEVKDAIPPVITGISVYPLGAAATVNGKRQVKKLIPVKTGNTYSLSKTDTLLVNGEIGFGISCYDKENAGSGTNNVFSIEMQAGGKRIFYYEMGSFSFDNARYVNTLIDYSEKIRKHQTIQKCFVSKNNLLEIYKDVQNRGILHFNDDAEHWITFITKDYAGNTAQLALKVRSSAAQKIKTAASSGLLDCFQNHHLSAKGMNVLIPDSALYDDEHIQIKQTAPLKNTLSPVYSIGSETIPLQKAMVLTADIAAVPEKWRTKACIVSIGKGGLNYEGGMLAGNTIIAESRHFGKFAIAVDTVPPRLLLFTKTETTDSILNLRKTNMLKFKATDRLSGIKKYKATIDGNWVLCEYDAKNDLLIYTFDSAIKPGVHRFKLEVTDDKGNTSKWEKTFNR